MKPVLSPKSRSLPFKSIVVSFWITIELGKVKSWVNTIGIALSACAKAFCNASTLSTSTVVGVISSPGEGLSPPPSPGSGSGSVPGSI